MTAKLIIRSHGWKDTKTIARVSNPDYIDVPVTSRAQVGVDIMICLSSLSPRKLPRYFQTPLQ